MIQLLRLIVVAEPIDSVVHPEQLAGVGMPAESNRVSQAGCKDPSRFAIGRDAEKRRVFRRRLVARVAGAADGDIELFVRAYTDRAVRALSALGQIVHDARDVLEDAIAVDIRRKDVLDRHR